jgi:hypothetical protein
MELFRLLLCVHPIGEWCIKNLDEKNEFICELMEKEKKKKRNKNDKYTIIIYKTVLLITTTNLSSKKGTRWFTFSYQNPSYSK